MKSKNLSTTAVEVLRSRIENREACIAVIGLGYVGLPLIIRFSEEDFKTLGFDIDEDKVQKLNACKTYIQHIPEEKIAAAVKAGFKATSNFNQISDVDVIIICVPTPLGNNNEPDLSFIKNTMESIKPYLKDNQLLILESTTYPGTTEEEIVPIVERIQEKSNSQKPTTAFTFGENFFIGYSPEREDPGNKNFTTKTIPKVVSGYTNRCLEVTQTLYDQIVDQTIPVSSLKVAEMTKLLENIHRAVKIGLVNELKMVADKMDIDIYEVIDAASTKPFGFTPYYPGPGLGGHCIPIDPFYLTWKAKEVGLETRFIELAGEINTGMPNYVVQKVGEALSTVGKAIKDSRILILGLAYKKNLDDTRESPSLILIDILKKIGADVEYSDPNIPVAPKTRKFNFNLKSIDLTTESIKSFDMVVLSTDHDSFNYELIEKEAKIIIDTRGRFKNTTNIFSA